MGQTEAEIAEALNGKQAPPVQRSLFKTGNKRPASSFLNSPSTSLPPPTQPTVNLQPPEQPNPIQPGLSASAFAQESLHPFQAVLQKVKEILYTEGIASVPTAMRDDLTTLIQAIIEFSQHGKYQARDQHLLKQLQAVDELLRQGKQLSKTLTKQAPIYLQPQEQRKQLTPQPTNKSHPAAPTSRLTTAQVAALAHASNPDPEPIQKTKKPTKSTKKENPEIQQQSKRDKQLTLVRSESQKKNTTFEGSHRIIIRNHINKALQKNVVASVELDHFNSNLIITTLPDFNAKWLQQSEHLWTPKFPFPYLHSVVNETWHKVIVHNVPFYPAEEEDALLHVRKELLDYNELDIIGDPYWITSEEKRNSGLQYSGSIAIAFLDKKDALKAIKTKLYLFGLKCKAELMHTIKRTHQCKRCQGYGHHEETCKSPPACRFCAGEHYTAEHPCSICRTQGRKCKHTNFRCANCDQTHIAGSLECPHHLTIHNRHHNPSPTEEDINNQAGRTATSWY